jgi:hypothetical protein
MKIEIFLLAETRTKQQLFHKIEGLGSGISFPENGAPYLWAFRPYSSAHAARYLADFLSLDMSEKDSLIAFSWRYGIESLLALLDEQQIESILDSFPLHVGRPAQLDSQAYSFADIEKLDVLIDLYMAFYRLEHRPWSERAIQSIMSSPVASMVTGAQKILSTHPQDLEALSGLFTKHVVLHIQEYKDNDASVYELAITGKDAIGAAALATFLAEAKGKVHRRRITCRDCGRSLETTARGDFCKECQAKAYKTNPLYKEKKKIAARAARLKINRNKEFVEDLRKARDVDECMAIARKWGVGEPRNPGRRSQKESGA